MDFLGVESDVGRAAVKPTLALPATDPNYAECYGYLTHGQSQEASFTTFTSQFGQDAYLYRNYFLGKAQGSGFYLDVGANAPKELSNTWFFDKCLGWKGLCVEASPTRSAQLKEQRGCKVVHACAWDVSKTLLLSGSDANSINDHLMPGGSVAVPCRTIDDILVAEGVGKIDLFSLDIESAEPQALRGMDMRRWAPDVVTVETFWLNQTFHNSMFDLGYAITGFVGPDTIYVRRAAPHVVNPEHMKWGRNNIDNFRNEEQTRSGRCMDSITNPVSCSKGAASHAGSPGVLSLTATHCTLLPNTHTHAHLTCAGRGKYLRAEGGSVRRGGEGGSEEHLHSGLLIRHYYLIELWL